MSSIKLKHSGGNSVSLNPPTSAPTSSEVAFKLPTSDGSAGQVLMTDGSGNLSWTTPGAGKVLQVVSTESTSTVTSTGNVEQLLTLSITPSAANSKVLILASLTGQCQPSSSAYGSHRLFRGALNSTQIFSASGGQNAGNYNYVHLPINYLDSPNTTSAQSYTTGITRNSSGTTSFSSDGQKYTLTLMEIGA